MSLYRKSFLTKCLFVQQLSPLRRDFICYFYCTLSKDIQGEAPWRQLWLTTKKPWLGHCVLRVKRAWNLTYCCFVLFTSSSVSYSKTQTKTWNQTADRKMCSATLCTHICDGFIRGRSADNSAKWLKNDKMQILLLVYIYSKPVVQWW